MNSLSVARTPDGPLVELVIGLAAPDVQVLRQAGRPIPQSVTVQALLDCGSEITCADAQVLAALTSSGMTLARLVFTNVPALSGLGAACVYAAGLTIVHPSGDPKTNLHLQEHPIAEVALGHLGYQALIGRDILDECLFIYDGPGKTFTLAY